MTRYLRNLAPSVLALLLIGSFALGQGDQPQEPLVTGLTEPRLITFDEDGNLYVAEAGNGGDVSIEWGEPGRFLVPGLLGGTGQVKVVTPMGDTSILLAGLPSMNGANPIDPDSHERNVAGPHVAKPHDGSLWVTIGYGAVGTPTNPFTSTVLRLDSETMRLVDFVDVLPIEVENDFDGTGPGTNPTDIEFAGDGTTYIVDAGCNCLYTYSPSDGLELFTSWSEKPQAVPDTIDIGPDGHIYVGFLTGVPFPREGARIERWHPGGELVETFTGLTMVVDLLVDDDGTIYAVEFSEGLDQRGRLTPNSGRVVEVRSDGLNPVVEGLNFPYGIARSPEGTLYVVNNSAFTRPGFGEVLAIQTP